ncbi:MAG TPA: hemerythrin domain-containing protein [Myxococcota bacterium]|jgi:iron-sulfur cluster repair protein YtfE (RIC family)
MPATQIGLRLRVKRLAQQTAEQHRQLDALRKQVAAALERGERGDGQHALERFSAALAAHFDLEQGVFFPALHGLSPSRTQELEALEREHAGFLAELQRVREEMERAPAEVSGRAFARFLDGLGGHERREEKLVGSISDPN